LDLHSRRLVGWSIADHMRTELVTDALKAAADARGGNLRGAVFHSDNGAQYASKEFAQVCKDLGVIRSRGAVGTSADNAAAESRQVRQQPQHQASDPAPGFNPREAARDPLHQALE
jgi:transposase InsO family protein